MTIPNNLMAELAAMPFSDQVAVMKAAATTDPGLMGRMIEDATRAAELRASGDMAGCLEVVGKYRQIAAEMGLGEMFDRLFSDAMETAPDDGSGYAAE